jgi:hypothetical protein
MDILHCEWDIVRVTNDMRFLLKEDVIAYLLELAEEEYWFS